MVPMQSSELIKGDSLILKIKYWIASFVFGILFLAGCSPDVPDTQVPSPTVEMKIDPTSTIQPVPDEAVIEPATIPATPTKEIIPSPTFPPEVKADTPISQAEVLSVNLNGEPGNYSFSVTVSSPDEGCSQYADWWEVTSMDRELIYRRVLHHSHVNEQPFTRSGGPVMIEDDAVVLVRVHMNTTGYSDLAMKGSPEQGFEPTELSPGFAEELSKMSPLPGDCGF